MSTKRKFSPKRLLKRASVTALVGLLLLPVASGWAFPRAVETIPTLGPKASRANIGCLREAVAHVLWCNGPGTYERRPASLEAKVDLADGVTKHSLQLARILVQVDRPEQAEASYRRLLELEPESPDMLSGLGDIDNDGAGQ